jgi:SAM-dependent methyltransferase
MPAFQRISRPANFNRIARVYRWLEYLSFGPMLERCRFYRLSQLATCRRALVIGDGDGRFLARLLQRNPQLETEAVDTSPEMLRLLEQRAAAAGGSHRLTVHCQDARVFFPSWRYDLVATHFFLDCLSTEEVAALAERIRPRLLPGAVWIVSDFTVPHGAAAFPSRLIVSFLYAAFGVLTGLETRRLPRHKEALQSAGFALSDRKTWLGGLLFSEAWQATDEPRELSQ